MPAWKPGKASPRRPPCRNLLHPKRGDLPMRLGSGRRDALSGVKMEQPNEENNGKGYGGDGCQEKNDEEERVAAGVGARLLFFAEQEPVVAAVGFPGDVESVSDDGNSAYRCFEKDIGEHADEGDEGGTASPRGEDDEAGG